MCYIHVHIYYIYVHSASRLEPMNYSFVTRTVFRTPASIWCIYKCISRAIERNVACSYLYMLLAFYILYISSGTYAYILPHIYKYIYTCVLFFFCVYSLFLQCCYYFFFRVTFSIYGFLYMPKACFIHFSLDKVECATRRKKAGQALYIHIFVCIYVYLYHWIVVQKYKCLFSRLSVSTLSSLSVLLWIMRFGAKYICRILNVGVNGCTKCR